VNATRYGCSDTDTGKYSKQAFELLHRRYAKSEWAGKLGFVDSKRIFNLKRNAPDSGASCPERIGGCPRGAYGLGGAGVEAGFGVAEAGLVAAGLAGVAEALAG
jgi:hypothetical protein